ncbi:MAG: hypothetical protein GY832_44410, partial [Chloroflexi bacterium]|nr:hypothetical protein [Chloroflexota bacterium]
MTQMAARQAQLVGRMNAFTQAQSQGHRQRSCGPSGSVGGLWDYIQSGRLLPDVVRWGLNEVSTNPFWQQEVSPENLWNLMMTGGGIRLNPSDPNSYISAPGLVRIAPQIAEMAKDWIDGQIDYMVEVVKTGDARMLITGAFNL